jgi:hypothetical protein
LPAVAAGIVNRKAYRCPYDAASPFRQAPITDHSEGEAMQRIRAVDQDRWIRAGRCCRLAIVGLVVGQMAVAATSNAAGAAADTRSDADALLVVDCLLPAQVRQLGTGITYLAPRRAIKTAASACAIRGGEYVAYDRANLATALRVWLPQAEQGDKVAQTHVGEIYEKGMGAAPDYVSAAKWYAKAAEQGYPRALTNLGFLHERGLGVPRDPVAALGLYRRAAGIDGAISLDSAPPAPPGVDVDALRRELEHTRQELERARRMLDEERLKSSRETERLLQQKQRADAAGNADETRRLESLLKAREAELEKRRQQVYDAERSAEQYKTRLATLEGEVNINKAQVARLEAARKSPSPGVATAPPAIQIIDPPVVVTRDVASVKVRADVRTRDVVGRVTSPAGLLSLTANDVAQSVDANGLFKTKVDLAGGKTRVTLLAVDRAGQSARLEFFLEADPSAARGGAAVPPARFVGIEAGNYHALLIGNQKYTKLQRLNTPEADITDLAPILRSRYGFKVKVLLNATRYEMLTELNKMRDTLTERDNLLIYYAGHGELDRANGIANWLPIDAEPTSNANWISSSSLTEMLNAMAAKHVLIIADSCYSGALTRSSIGQLQTGLTDEARLNWLKQIAEARSRTALTSGGLKPVLDGGGGKYSVFAAIFIDILSQNQDVLEGMRLYREISARVLDVARRQRFDQRPEYGAIRFAGGDSGDFLFVPKP